MEQYLGICQKCLKHWLFYRKDHYAWMKFFCPQCDPKVYEQTILKLKKLPIISRFEREKRNARKRWRNKIEKDARRVIRKLGKSHCEKCRYKPLETVHHINPVGNFLTGTHRNVVNEPSNLMALCHKCHKMEHDKAIA